MYPTTIGTGPFLPALRILGRDSSVVHIGRTSYADEGEAYRIARVAYQGLITSLESELINQGFIRVAAAPQEQV